jgi:hypothetical protein
MVASPQTNPQPLCQQEWVHGQSAEKRDQPGTGDENLDLSRVHDRADPAAHVVRVSEDDEGIVVRERKNCS